MFRPTLPLALALSASLLVGACGGDEGGGGGDAATSPTKADVVKHLEGLLAAIESEDWDGAASRMQLGPKAPPKERWSDVFPGFVRRSEISKEGIAILAEKGTFGPLSEIFAEGGKGWAERAEVPLDKCYGLSHGGAEVAVYASSDGLKLIRLDDVGKLR